MKQDLEDTSNPPQRLTGAAAPPTDISSDVDSALQLLADPELFVNEDWTKRENRINVLHFALCSYSPWRSWYLERLNLPTGAEIFPLPTEVTDEGQCRIDLGILSNGKIIARVEHELDRDDEQYRRHDKHFPGLVKVVLGRRHYGGDLSMEDMADELRADRLGWPVQTRLLRKLLLAIIDEGLDHYKRRLRSPHQEVSPEMRATALFAGLVDRLGDRLVLDPDRSAVPGFLYATARGPRGYSVRAFSGVPTGDDPTVSLIYRTRASDWIFCQWRQAKLEVYFPDRHPAVQEFVSLFEELGGDRTRDRSKVLLGDVEDALDEFAAALLRFAERPQRLRQSEPKVELMKSENQPVA
jgi:hypothetical protein